MRHVVAILLLAMPFPASAAPAKAVPSAASNLDFEAPAALDGWGGGGTGYERTIDTTQSHGGTNAARVHYSGSLPPTARAFGTFTQAIDAASFKGKRIRYSGWLRTEIPPGAWAGLWFRVDGKDGDVLAFDNMDSTGRAVRGTTPWTRYEIVMDVSQDAAFLVFGALLSGDGTAWVDDLAIEVAPADAPTTTASVDAPSPGIVEARGAYEITASPGLGSWFARLMGSESTTASATILVPVMLAYGDQVPLDFKLSTTPADRLMSARITQVGGNPVAEVVVGPVGESPVKLEWSSLVACGPGKFDAIPALAPVPDTWPTETRPWLRSTRCVQSADPRIQAVAKEIRGDSSDVMAIIVSTLKRTRALYEGQTGRCTELDAVGALSRQGSCTSCANLVAALLRANSIPARIVSGYPTWSGPLQTHYIVEAFVPGFGWYPIESTQLRAPWPPYQQAQVAIIPPEHEDRSEPRPSAAGGVPYLSLTELTGDTTSVMLLGTIDKDRNCDHVGTIWRAFPRDAPRADWDRALDVARRRWNAWIDSKPAAAAGGTLELHLATRDVLEKVVDPAALATAVAGD
jgi:transglutaminase-like putative cysteine protease